MAYKIMTIGFDDKTEGFNDEEINTFALNKKVISKKEKFFRKNGKFYWTIFFEYESVLKEPEKKNTSLSEAETVLYEKLREWRNETAEKEGIPPFIIMNNKQLTEVVVKAPKTLEMLKSIYGFGAKKSQKYGNDILKMIKNFYEQK